MKTEPSIDANMYLQLITYTIKCSNSLQAMSAPLRKIGKKKSHFWIFGWVSLIFTHWSAATALVEKDKAESFHRWPQYNALPGRVKGRYWFRDSKKVQLVSYIMQIFFGSLNIEKSMYPHYAKCPESSSYILLYGRTFGTTGWIRFKKF